MIIDQVVKAQQLTKVHATELHRDYAWNTEIWGTYGVNGYKITLCV